MITTARLVAETPGVIQRWRVDLAIGNQTKPYRVATYPDSDLLRVSTLDGDRSVRLKKWKIDEIRDAIRSAQKKAADPS